MNTSPPLDSVEKVLARWWLLVALFIAGGLAGWLASLAKPPVYEARGNLVILFGQEERDGYSDNQMTMELSNVNALISQRALAPELITEFGGACPGITTRDLQIERRSAQWDLVVRCSTAQGAADVANAWLDSAVAVLDEAYAHGLEVERLGAELGILKECKADRSQPLCASIPTYESLKEQIDSVLASLNREKHLSGGVTPDLVYRIESYASVPDEPAANNPGALILAGAFIGFLAALLLVLGLPGIPALKRK
jgi:hypothetical protein